VGIGGEPGDEREQLVTLVAAQVADAECWQRAETIMRAGSFRERLDALGVVVTADIAAAVMAAAMLLASASEEFGGDYRDALADLAALGLELLDT
jgi:hypothetical protein